MFPPTLDRKKRSEYETQLAEGKPILFEWRGKSYRITPLPETKSKSNVFENLVLMAGVVIGFLVCELLRFYW